MKSNIFKTGIMMHWYKIVLIGIASILLAACSKTSNEAKYIIRVDMSKEHDAGRFKSEVGDKISIAGNFNGWKEDSLFLSDAKGNWIFNIDLGKSLKNLSGKSPTDDTLEFKFVVHAGDGREVDHQGWEATNNRQMTLADIKKKKPLFIFNEEYEEKETFEATITVGMNNQKVLGFFRPEEGDEVIVSGSFCGWSSKGIPMKDEDGTGIYSVTLPVKINPKELVEYKFRIMTKRKALIPNKGWETQVNRQWKLTSSMTEFPYAEFNDIRRVARFVINTEQWEQEGKFKPKKGDILQIKILLDGKESLSDALFQVKDHVYETALVIPLTAKEVQWQAVRNIKEDITQLKSVEVDLRGTTITL
jgi:hypothetical protein